MKLLLDTHTLIWMDSNSGQLSRAAWSAINDPSNTKYLSVVSVWEIIIKTQSGKLALHQPLSQILADQFANDVQILPVLLPHVLVVDSLPQVHKDPFDRLLAAQPIAEDAEFVTADRVFAQYPVRILW